MVASLQLSLDLHPAKFWSRLGVKLWHRLENGLVMEKLKVVIILAKRVRSRGRDRGLERFDGDCEIAQREEKRFLFFFLISGEEKLVYKDLFGFS